MSQATAILSSRCELEPSDHIYHNKNSSVVKTFVSLFAVCFVIVYSDIIQYNIIIKNIKSDINMILNAAM